MTGIFVEQEMGVVEHAFRRQRRNRHHIAGRLNLCDEPDVGYRK